MEDAVADASNHSQKSDSKTGNGEQEVVGAVADRDTGSSEETANGAGEDGEEDLDVIAEQDSHALDARLEVIGGVLASIDDVVEDDQESDGKGGEHGRAGVGLFEGGKTGTVGGEDEVGGQGHAKDDLGEVGESLAEGVDDGQNSDENTKLVALRGKGREAQERQGDASNGEDVTGRGGDGATGDGTSAATLRLAVKVLIDVVVPGTAGSAHSEGPSNVQQGLEDEVAGGETLRAGRGSVHDADEVGEVAQVVAMGQLEAHELEVGHDGFGDERERATLIPGVGVRH